MYLKQGIWTGRGVSNHRLYTGLLVYDKAWYGVDGYKMTRAYIVPADENIIIPQGDKLIIKKWVEVDPVSIKEAI